MIASPKRRPRWSNIGFAVLTLGLVSVMAGPHPLLNPGTGSGRIIELTLLAGTLVGFLYPLGEERLERRRVLVGVVIGCIFLVLTWTSVLAHL